MSDLFCAANVVVVQDPAAVPPGERFAAVWCSPSAEATAVPVAERLGVRAHTHAGLGTGHGVAAALQELADLFRGETVLLVVESDEDVQSVEVAVPAVEGLDLGVRR